MIKFYEKIPPSSQSNFKDDIDLIERYKVLKCAKISCKYGAIKDFDSLDGQLLYDCFDYHFPGDQRRPPFTKLNLKNGHTKNILAYSGYLSLETVLERNLSDTSKKHCLNSFEYFFHPINYKAIPCQLSQNQSCKTEFCPYYHTQEEKSFFENYRKTFENSPNQEKPVLEELTSSVAQFRENMKKLSMGSELLAAEKHIENEKPGEVMTGKRPTKKPISAHPSERGYYIYSELVGFIEDHYHEFKIAKPDTTTVTKYICGFLNSKGGTIYFGITDQGHAKGCDMRESEQQNFKKMLYDNLRNFTPPLNDKDVTVEFVPVHRNDRNDIKIQNVYVVEIKIRRRETDDIYFTHKKECYAKRSASLNQLTAKEIK